MDHPRKGDSLSEAEREKEEMIFRRENTRMRVFLDANILFSASNTQSKTAIILRLLFNKNHDVVTSSHVWKETQRNLGTKCPDYLSGLEIIRGRVITVDNIGTLLDVVCEEKDKPVFAGAIGAGCTHLWTGDKAHFGKFFGRKVQGVMVVSSDQLIDLLSMD